MKKSIQRKWNGNNLCGKICNYKYCLKYSDVIHVTEDKKFCTRVISVWRVHSKKPSTMSTIADM